MIFGVLDVGSSEYVNNEFMILDKIEEMSKSKELLCPNCLSKVYVHSSYRRNVINSEFEKISIRIIKVRCTNNSCKKIHSIIPNFVVPQKQYSKEIIVKALCEDKNPDCPADNSTILRWIREGTNAK